MVETMGCTVYFQSPFNRGNGCDLSPFNAMISQTFSPLLIGAVVETGGRRMIGMRDAFSPLLIGAVVDGWFGLFVFQSPFNRGSG